MIILRYPELVTVQVIYYIPKRSILQEFLWQCDDTVPDLPRIHRFLDFWQREIDAIISEVMVSSGTKPDWRALDIEIRH